MVCSARRHCFATLVTTGHLPRGADPLLRQQRIHQHVFDLRRRQTVGRRYSVDTDSPRPAGGGQECSRLPSRTPPWCADLLHNPDPTAYHPLMHLDPLHILLVSIAGWMNREQDAVIDFLQEENRVLRVLLGNKRPRLSVPSWVVVTVTNGSAVGESQFSGRDRVTGLQLPTTSLGRQHLEARSAAERRDPHPPHRRCGRHDAGPMRSAPLGYGDVAPTNSGAGPFSPRRRSEPTATTKPDASAGTLKSAGVLKRAGRMYTWMEHQSGQDCDGRMSFDTAYRRRVVVEQCVG